MSTHDTYQALARNPNAVLASAQVVDLRAKFAAGGWSKAAIAREFGISRAQAWAIIERRRWPTI